MTTEIPVKASTIVFVTTNQIIQYLRYFYLDSDRIYRKYELTDCLNGELERMETNLQIFLDQDAVFLNETDCNLQVSEVRQWYLKEDFSKVLVEFVIRSTPYQLCSSPNEITLESELEKAPYPCFSAWFFPGKVLAAKSVMTTIAKENRILLRARTEEWIGGKDEFLFDFRRSITSENLFAKSILFSERSKQS
ncbi:MAG: hypothetical protein ACE5OZ_11255 [Candidatus Heimdallarchaeota archaeon]